MSDKKWDYVIVGAGILGMAIAYHLKKSSPQKQIVVIDKFTAAGQGNTIKSNACYRNVFNTQINVMMSTSSVNYYKKMEAEGADLGIKEIGYLWLLNEKQYEARIKPSIEVYDGGQIKNVSVIDFMKMNSIDYQIFQKKEIEKMLPDLKVTKNDTVDSFSPSIVDIEYGLLGKDCGNLAPDLLVKEYEKKFIKLGGLCLYQTEVQELLLKEKSSSFEEDYITTVWRDSEIGAIRVTNQKGEKQIIQTEKLIIATGAWINQLLEPLGVNTGIKPKKRQLFTICGVDELVMNEYFDSRYNTIPFIILPTAGVFIKPLPEAKCVEVGVSDDIGRRFETRNPNIETHENHLLDYPLGEEDFYIYNILPILQAYFPNIFDKNHRISKPSAGMYAYSMDKQPVITAEKKLGNLFYVSGTSGSGIMKADSIARVMTALVMGSEYAILYGGHKIKVSDFSLDKRNLQQESLVL